MYGMIRWTEQQKKGVALETVTVLRQPFLCADILWGGRTPRQVIRRRVSAAGKRLHRQGVTQVVLPEGFPFAAELERWGVAPVSTLSVRREIAPPSWLAALRAARGVSASMISTTASACVRSMRPFKKARLVNSPASACRAPSANSASSAARSTTGEPWHCSSAVSSPV